MTYDTFERSNYAGVPVTLYEFRLGDSAVWRYSSGTESVTLSGNVYEAMPISNTSIVQSGDVQNDDVTITLPARTDVASLFIATPPSESIFVTLRNKHRGDEDAPVVWAGTVKTGRRKSTIEFEVICRTLTSSLNRLGVRMGWGRGCQHALYDRNCRVDKAAFATLVQVAAKTAGTLTVPVSSFGDGYMAGGFVEFDLMAGVKDTRAIEYHVGSVIGLLTNTDGINVGDWITVRPGCDLTSGTCLAKFGNLSNYGGFNMMPTRSPFDGNPVF